MKLLLISCLIAISFAQTERWAPEGAVKHGSKRVETQDAEAKVGCDNSGWWGWFACVVTTAATNAKNAVEAGAADAYKAATDTLNKMFQDEKWIEMMKKAAESCKDWMQSEVNEFKATATPFLKCSIDVLKDLQTEIKPVTDQMAQIASSGDPISSAHDALIQTLQQNCPNFVPKAQAAIKSIATKAVDKLNGGSFGIGIADQIALFVGFSVELMWWFDIGDLMGLGPGGVQVSFTVQLTPSIGFQAGDDVAIKFALSNQKPKDQNGYAGSIEFGGAFEVGASLGVQWNLDTGGNSILDHPSGDQIDPSAGQLGKYIYSAGTYNLGITAGAEAGFNYGVGWTWNVQQKVYHPLGGAPSSEAQAVGDDPPSDCEQARAAFAAGWDKMVGSTHPLNPDGAGDSRVGVSDGSELNLMIADMIPALRRQTGFSDFTINAASGGMIIALTILGMYSFAPCCTKDTKGEDYQKLMDSDV